MTTQTTSRLNFIPQPQVAEFVNVDYYDANGVGYSNVTGKPSIPRGTKPLQNEKYINWTDDLGLPFVKNSPVDPEVARGRKLAQGFDDYINDLKNQEATRKFYETRTGFQKVDNRTVWSQPNSTTPFDANGNLVPPILPHRSVVGEADLTATIHPREPETRLPAIQPRNPDMPQMPRRMRINNDVPIPFQNVRSVDIPSFNQRRVSSEPQSFVKSLPVLNTITPDQGGSQPRFDEGFSTPRYTSGEKGKGRAVFEPENKGLDILSQPSSSSSSKPSKNVIVKGTKPLNYYGYPVESFYDLPHIKINDKQMISYDLREVSNTPVNKRALAKKIQDNSNLPVIHPEDNIYDYAFEKPRYKPASYATDVKNQERRAKKNKKK